MLKSRGAKRSSILPRGRWYSLADFNYEDRCRLGIWPPARVQIDASTNESFIIRRAIIVINMAVNKEKVCKRIFLPVVVAVPPSHRDFRHF